MSKSKRKQWIIECLLVVFLLFIIFGKYLAPHDPYAADMALMLQPPSMKYPFGTDNLGRCILSRILEGASVSVLSAAAVVLCVSVIGTSIGIFAGYFGGKLDAFLMKVTVVVQVLPSFVLAVAIAGILGPGLKNALFALIVMYWTTYARLSRSLVLQIRNEEYLDAARMCQAGKGAIIFRYILPNILSPLLVTIALDVGNIILTLAGLSFLGLGAQPPLVEWGVMISSTRSYLQTAPWCIVFPSLVLFVTVMIFNMAGDGLRDSMDLTKEN